jgi:Na+(H+)/acetate symporter ActP
MANAYGILIGISFMLAGLLLLIIYTIIKYIIPINNTGPFNSDPTTICIVGIIIGFIIICISALIPDN